MVTPRSSSATTRSVGGVRFGVSAGFGIRQPCGLVTVCEAKMSLDAHVLVVVAHVVAEALADAVEHRRVHDQPADVAREIVRRAAQQPVRPGGDAPVGLEPALQIFARCAAAGSRSRRSRRPPRRSSPRGFPARACGHRSWRRNARRCGTPDAWSRPRPVRRRRRPAGRRGCFRGIPDRSAAWVASTLRRSMSIWVERVAGAEQRSSRPPVAKTAPERYQLFAERTSVAGRPPCRRPD